MTLDLTAILLYSSYSFVKKFPFSAWGDAAFLSVQTVVIALLVLHYGGSNFQAVLYLIVYLAVNFVLMSGLTPVEILWTLQGFNILVVIFAKLTQAFTNFKNGHTGQLSGITLVMLFGGSLARIFTSIQETGDKIVILTYVAATLCNAVLVVQLLYYWNVSPVAKKIAKKVD